MDFKGSMCFYLSCSWSKFDKFLMVILNFTWNMPFKTCWASTADFEIPTLIDLALTWEVRTKYTYTPTDLLTFSIHFLKTFKLGSYQSSKLVWCRQFCGIYTITKSPIYRRIKPILIHSYFIRINIIVIINVVICTANKGNFNFVKTILMW